MTKQPARVVYGMIVVTHQAGAPREVELLFNSKKGRREEIKRLASRGMRLKRCFERYK